jgi:hypothetical protein
MDSKAFQEFYPDQFNQCYGCGQLNEHGLQIKVYWDGEESLCVFTRAYHTSVPGYLWGLIASLIDCHSTGTLLRLLSGLKAGLWTPNRPSAS